MSSIDVGSDLMRPKIVDYANQCLGTLQQCLLTASYIHPREFNRVEDQIARFHTWSTSIGIFAPGKASVDHRLRYAPEVYTVIVGLLESLRYRTRACSDRLDVVRDSTASRTVEDPDEALGRTLHDIATELSHLNKISNVIRRASKQARDARADEFQIKNDDGDNVEDLLLRQFVHYIQDRFPNISETLRQRLSRTMLLRRRMILYRRRRQEKLAAQPQKAVLGLAIGPPVGGNTEHAAQTVLQEVSHPSPDMVATRSTPSQIRSATTLLQDKFNSAVLSPSVVSASKTMPFNKHENLRFPPAPGYAARQRYEQLRGRRLAANQSRIDHETVLGRARLEETSEFLQRIGEITCPYCLDALPAKEAFEEPRWRDHVLNDLEPYICLVEGCTQPDEIYTHSDAWINHLHQHGKHWRCPSHHESGLFWVREDYFQHLRDAHNSRLPDTKLRALANRNARNTLASFQSCPLCGNEGSGDESLLLEHITGHLRSLALISLPSYQDVVLDGVEEEFGSEETSYDSSRRIIDNSVETLDDGMIASSLDAERLEMIDLDSNNFLGGVHHEWNADDRDSWGTSLGIDDIKPRNPLDNIENDPILRSILQRQEDNTTISGQRAETGLTPEEKNVPPKFFWRNPNGTQGPAVGTDYELLARLPQDSLGPLIAWSGVSATQEVWLVTEDGKVHHVAVEFLRFSSNVVELKRRLKIRESLRHKHIETVLGSFSCLSGAVGLRYGIILSPLPETTLQMLLDKISVYNKQSEGKGITWSPHQDVNKLLSHFACLSKTVLYLHQRPQPIAHQDITPMNILIDASEDVILAGFDTVKVHDENKQAKPYGSSDGAVLDPPKDFWEGSERDNGQALERRLEQDVISLGFVFLEMATVLFGKSIFQMRETMTQTSRLGSVREAYSMALKEGKIKDWLDILENTPASTPAKVPKTLILLDYIQPFLCAIKDMVSAQQDDHQALERACEVFGCLSTHC